MTECHTMPAFISDLLVPLRRLVGGMTIRERLPQIEVAVGDREGGGHRGPAKVDGAGGMRSSQRGPCERGRGAGRAAGG